MGPFHLSGKLAGASVVIAALSVSMSLLGLLDPQVYAKETENWTLQAQGQDIGNFLTAVVLVYAAFRAWRGSTGAYLVWVGALLYFIYAYLIYAVAVHLNYLFLGYVAVLGLSAFALIGALYTHSEAEIVWEHTSMPTRFPSIVLFLIGGLFGVLWLSEVIPALLSDSVPQSLEDAGLIVNPIHVVDLSLVLPAMIITGYLLIKKSSAGIFWVVPWLAFSAFMGSSIVAAMLLMVEQGETEALPPMMMVSIVVVLSSIAVYQRLAKPHTP